jgi:hypothetical protein
MHVYRRRLLLLLLLLFLLLPLGAQGITETLRFNACIQVFNSLLLTVRLKLMDSDILMGLRKHATFVKVILLRIQNCGSEKFIFEFRFDGNEHRTTKM